MGQERAGIRTCDHPRPCWCMRVCVQLCVLTHISTIKSGMFVLAPPSRVSLVSRRTVFGCPIMPACRRTQHSTNGVDGKGRSTERGRLVNSSRCLGQVRHVCPRVVRRTRLTGHGTNQYERPPSFSGCTRVFSPATALPGEPAVPTQ